MASISKYKYKPIVVAVLGKNRMIRDIHLHTDDDLIAKYRNHDIFIKKESIGGFSVSIVNLDTGIKLHEKHYSPYDFETLLEMIERVVQTILLQ